MFGYVRPLQPELKCREYDLYRATYCGLCRTLRKRYGMLAPMFLSFDMTFLALLLEQEDTKLCKGGCHANLLQKKEMVCQSDALELAADVSMILTWFQLKDTIIDEGFWKKTGAKLLCIPLKRHYKKAQIRHPKFCEQVQDHLSQLATLEQAKCDSIDAVAHHFATILQSIPIDNEDIARKRATEQLLYHVGRWIYLVDARDDFDEDMQDENYNPLRYRYGENGDDAQLQITLENSMNLSRSAFHLLSLGERGDIIENILYLGIPATQNVVFRGQWKAIQKQKIWRTRYE